MSLYTIADDIDREYDNKRRVLDSRVARQNALANEYHPASTTTITVPKVQCELKQSLPS